MKIINILSESPDLIQEIEDLKEENRQANGVIDKLEQHITRLEDKLVKLAKQAPQDIFFHKGAWIGGLDPALKQKAEDGDVEFLYDRNTRDAAKGELNNYKIKAMIGLNPTNRLAASKFKGIGTLYFKLEKRRNSLKRKLTINRKKANDLQNSLNKKVGVTQIPKGQAPRLIPSSTHPKARMLQNPFWMTNNDINDSFWTTDERFAGNVADYVWNRPTKHQRLYYRISEALQKHGLTLDTIYSLKLIPTGRQPADEIFIIVGANGNFIWQDAILATGKERRVIVGGRRVNPRTFLRDADTWLKKYLIGVDQKDIKK